MKSFPPSVALALKITLVEPGTLSIPKDIMESFPTPSRAFMMYHRGGGYIKSTRNLVCIVSTSMILSALGKTFGFPYSPLGGSGEPIPKPTITRKIISPQLHGGTKQYLGQLNFPMDQRSSIHQIFTEGHTSIYGSDKTFLC